MDNSRKEQFGPIHLPYFIQTAPSAYNPRHFDLRPLSLSPRRKLLLDNLWSQRTVPKNLSIALQALAHEFQAHNNEVYHLAPDLKLLILSPKPLSPLLPVFSNLSPFHQGGASSSRPLVPLIKINKAQQTDPIDESSGSEPAIPGPISLLQSDNPRILDGLKFPRVLDLVMPPRVSTIVRTFIGDHNNHRRHLFQQLLRKMNNGKINKPPSVHFTVEDLVEADKPPCLIHSYHCSSHVKSSMLLVGFELYKFEEISLSYKKQIFTFSVFTCLAYGFCYRVLCTDPAQARHHLGERLNHLIHELFRHYQKSAKTPKLFVELTFKIKPSEWSGPFFYPPYYLINTYTYPIELYPRISHHQLPLFQSKLSPPAEYRAWIVERIEEVLEHWNPEKTLYVETEHMKIFGSWIASPVSYYKSLRLPPQMSTSLDLPDRRTFKLNRYGNEEITNYDEESSDPEPPSDQEPVAPAAVEETSSHSEDEDAFFGPHLPADPMPVVCTLGSVVFASILLIRGVWTGLIYFQGSRNFMTNRNNRDDSAWTGAQPA